MRVTTWLLMEHVPESIARLAESFLLGKNRVDIMDAPIWGPVMWMDIATGEHMELIAELIDRTPWTWHLDALLRGFCLTGNIKMMNHVINTECPDRMTTFDYNACLLKAIEGRHTDAALLMVARGGRIKQLYHEVVEDAIAAGDFELCKIVHYASGGAYTSDIISRSATSRDMNILNIIGPLNEFCKNSAFICFCKNGYAAGVKWFLSDFQETQTPKFVQDMMDDGLLSAIAYLQSEIAHVLLECGANPTLGMIGSCKHCDHALADILIAAGASPCDHLKNAHPQ